MGHSFLLPGLSVVSKTIDIAAPNIRGEPFEEWLYRSGIVGWYLIWVADPNPPYRVNKDAILYQTYIVFDRARDAVLFKLRWL